MHVNNARQFPAFYREESYHEQDDYWYPDGWQIRKGEKQQEEGEHPEKNGDTVADVHGAKKISRLTVETVKAIIAVLIHLRHVEDVFL